MEGAQPGICGQAMTTALEIEASKTEHGENFPVASFLITPRLRQPILSFYRFARAADDIADHPRLSEQDKFAGLAALEDTLLGKSNNAKAALPLRRVLAEKGFAPTHPLDLLTAGLLERSSDARAHPERVVRRIRHRIRLDGSDVPVANFQPHR